MRVVCQSCVCGIWHHVCVYGCASAAARVYLGPCLKYIDTTLQGPRAMTEKGLRMQPILILMHELKAGSNESFVRDLAQLAFDQSRMRVVVFNCQCCCHSTLQRARGYCAGCTLDMAQLVTNLSERYPHAPLVACGFSLGADVLCKYLGVHQACALTAAVCVSNPCDMNSTCAMMRKATSPAKGLHSPLLPHKHLVKPDFVTRDKKHLVMPHFATPDMRQETAALPRNAWGHEAVARQRAGHLVFALPSHVYVFMLMYNTCS